ncbi:MAG TPA: hypothetical protein ENK54_05980 [Thiotrichales bacterium]|nr:hypothetical protein [Thiotrichales bacterium]
MIRTLLLQRPSYLVLMGLLPLLAGCLDSVVDSQGDNSPPFFVSESRQSTVENSATAFTAVADDPDSDPLAFHITGGADAYLFQVDGATGDVRFETAADFEHPADRNRDNRYEVEISVSDGSASSRRLFLITVTDLDEAPEFSGATEIIVADGATEAFTVEASDPEGATVLFSLEGGEDRELFSIDSASGGVAFLAPVDHANPADADGDNTYEIEVGASDGGLVARRNYRVIVSAGDGSPVFVSETEQTALENDTAAFTAEAVDPQGGAVRYALVGGADRDHFVVDGGSGVVTFTSPPDYESPGDADGDNLYEVEVSATDDDGSSSRLFQVRVENVNEAPSIVTPAEQATIENETALFSVAASDPEEDTVRFAIAGGDDAALFSVDAASGTLRFVTPPDFEAPADQGADNRYEVVINASDGELGDSRVFLITVGNINEAPTIINETSDFQVAENTTQAFLLETEDPENDPLTYAIGGGADGALFLVDGSGQVSFLSPPDFESPGDGDGNNRYEVMVTASDGEFTASRLFSVTVTDIDEAPQFVSDPLQSVEENSTTAFVTEAVDPEGATVTFTLTGGVDMARFSLDGTTGSLDFVTPPDFENPVDSDGDNLYEVEITASDGTFDATRLFTLEVVNVPEPPATPDLTLTSAATKRLDFQWTEAAGATTYQILEDAEGSGTFTAVGSPVGGYATSTSIEIAVHRLDWERAAYRLEACNHEACSHSNTVSPAEHMLATIGYLKGTDTSAGDRFGLAVALSGDGNTLAVGAPEEDSDSNGLPDGAPDSGAVYLFVRDGEGSWSEIQRLKAPAAAAGDRFGDALALSDDGSTLAVGAWRRDLAGSDSGAVHLYRLTGGSWSLEATLSPSNAGAGDQFGRSLALSDDGSLLLAGAPGEDSAFRGVGQSGTDGGDDLAPDAGAAYLFMRSGGEWTEQAYYKADNSGAGDRFGMAVAMPGGSGLLAIGAPGESGAADTRPGAGAVYLFHTLSGVWQQAARIHASNADAGDGFGASLSLSDDGGYLLVGAPGESSAPPAAGGTPDDDSLSSAGAAYLFEENGGWNETALFKPSSADAGDRWGYDVRLSGDGGWLLIGAPLEDGTAVGVGGDASANGAADSGAAWFFAVGAGGTVSEVRYVKASNSEAGDVFSHGLAVDDDGSTLAVGAGWGEDGLTTPEDNAAPQAGALYLY